MEAMTLATATLVDRAKVDLRLESAMCKMWATERAWRIVNDTMQIRGGRGYETAASLRVRGESPDPVERMLRDSRINTIFEGSSEIMRLFIAREALDPHLKIGGPVLNTRLSISVRTRTALNAALFYARWYPSMWLPLPVPSLSKLHRELRSEVRWCARTSKRLSRELFHQMLRYGPGLERRQLLLGRFVDIGTELFAISVAVSRAQTLLDQKAPEAEQGRQLAKYFCRAARFRIDELFRSTARNTDQDGYRLAKEVIAMGFDPQSRN